MGQKCTRNDFEWTMDEHPHTGRRKAILQEYPQIKKLFGHEHKFKWVVTVMVVTQLASLYVVKDLSWLGMFIMAYCFGGVINHALELAMHELSHNMAFGYARPNANKLFAIFANFPLGFPMAVSFKRYHLDHHRYQGVEILDTDVPTYLEGQLFCTTFGKVVWVFLQPFFYSFRPVIIYPKVPNSWEIFNITVQSIFNGLVYYFFGLHTMVYLFVGTFIAMGLHPLAGHFISEHYMFKVGYETYSYYGKMNWIAFNVGYHNEHHDLPAVPGAKLGEINRIAKKYYDSIPQCESWTKTIYDFINDPAIGPYARIKRRQLGLRG